MPAPFTIDVVGNTRPLENSINEFARRVPAINLKVNTNGLALGRITSDVNEFNKSLQASNARLIAFGAGAIVLRSLTDGLKALVENSIKVEKSFVDINTVLNASSANFEKFKNQIFSIAKETGQSFDDTIEVAKEFSRAGKDLTDTLSATRDALILTRISGASTADSFKALVAATETYKDELLTTTEVVNKLAAVDAKFAISSGDLAGGLTRVASTAKDAGVSFDELIALITSAQQVTQRGATVISNAFKTIFTRENRSQVLDQLEQMGVSVRDMQGNMLPAIQVLKNLANTYEQLPQAQKAFAAELVGGVYQVNVLKATLNDLSTGTSNYSKALNISTNATDEAIRRNAEYNKTLSALANESLVNIVNMTSKIGTLTLGPSIKKLLGSFNEVSSFADKNIGGESIGQKLGEGVLKGLGNALAGPGLVIGGALLGKLFYQFAAFTAKASAELLKTAQISEQQKNVQQGINLLLESTSGLYNAINNSANTRLQTEQLILRVLQQQQAATVQKATLSNEITSSVVRAGYNFNQAGGFKRTKADGFVPETFAAAEKALANQYGYTAGKVIPFQLKGTDSGMTPSQFIRQAGISKAGGFVPNAVVNTNEYLLTRAGSNATAIIPPTDASRIDINKASAMGYNLSKLSADGFVPNQIKSNRNLGYVGGEGLDRSPFAALSSQLIEKFSFLRQVGGGSLLKGAFNSIFNKEDVLNFAQEKVGNLLNPATNFYDKNFSSQIAETDKYHKNFQARELTSIRSSFDDLIGEKALKRRTKRGLVSEGKSIGLDPDYLKSLTKPEIANLINLEYLKDNQGALKGLLKRGLDTPSYSRRDLFTKNDITFGAGFGNYQEGQVSPLRRSAQANASLLKRLGLKAGGFVPVFDFAKQISPNVESRLKAIAEQNPQLFSFIANSMDLRNPEALREFGAMTKKNLVQITPKSLGNTTMYLDVNEHPDTLIKSINDKAEQFKLAKPFAEGFIPAEEVQAMLKAYTPEEREAAARENKFQEIRESVRRVLNAPPGTTVIPAYETQFYLNKGKPVTSQAPASVSKVSIPKASVPASVIPIAPAFNPPTSFSAPTGISSQIYQPRVRPSPFHPELTQLGYSEFNYPLNPLQTQNVLRQRVTNLQGQLPALQANAIAQEQLYTQIRPNLTNQSNNLQAAFAGTQSAISTGQIDINKVINALPNDLKKSLSEQKVLKSGQIKPNVIDLARNVTAENAASSIQTIDAELKRLSIQKGAAQPSTERLSLLQAARTQAENYLKLQNISNEAISVNSKIQQVDNELYNAKQAVLKNLEKQKGYSLAAAGLESKAQQTRETLFKEELDRANTIKKNEALQKRQIGLSIASFAVPAIGGVLANSFDNKQFSRGIEGVSQGAGIGLSLAALGNPYATAVGAIVGSLTAFKSVIDNLQPSVADLNDKFQEASRKQEEQNNSVSNFIELQDRLVTSYKEGGSQRSQSILQSRAGQALSRIDDPILRQQLLNANTTEERLAIAARSADLGSQRTSRLTLDTQLSEYREKSGKQFFGLRNKIAYNPFTGGYTDNGDNNVSPDEAKRIDEIVNTYLSTEEGQSGKMSPETIASFQQLGVAGQKRAIVALRQRQGENSAGAQKLQESNTQQEGFSSRLRNSISALNTYITNLSLANEQYSKFSRLQVESATQLASILGTFGDKNFEVSSQKSLVQAKAGLDINEINTKLAESYFNIPKQLSEIGQSARGGLTNDFLKSIDNLISDLKANGGDVNKMSDTFNSYLKIYGKSQELQTPESNKLIENMTNEIARTQGSANINVQAIQRQTETTLKLIDAQKTLSDRLNIGGSQLGSNSVGAINSARDTAFSYSLSRNSGDIFNRGRNLSSFVQGVNDLGFGNTIFGSGNRLNNFGQSIQKDLALSNISAITEIINEFKKSGIDAGIPTQEIGKIAELRSYQQLGKVPEAQQQEFNQLLEQQGSTNPIVYALKDNLSPLKTIDSNIANIANRLVSGNGSTGISSLEANMTNIKVASLDAKNQEISKRMQSRLPEENSNLTSVLIKEAEKAFSSVSTDTATELKQFLTTDNRDSIKNLASLLPASFQNKLSPLTNIDKDTYSSKLVQGSSAFIDYKISQLNRQIADKNNSLTGEDIRLAGQGIVPKVYTDIQKIREEIDVLEKFKTKIAELNIPNRYKSIEEANAKDKQEQDRLNAEKARLTPNVPISFRASAGIRQGIFSPENITEIKPEVYNETVSELKAFQENLKKQNADFARPFFAVPRVAAANLDALRNTASSFAQNNFTTENANDQRRTIQEELANIQKISDSYNNLDRQLTEEEKAVQNTIQARKENLNAQLAAIEAQKKLTGTTDDYQKALEDARYEISDEKRRSRLDTISGRIGALVEANADTEGTRSLLGQRSQLKAQNGDFSGGLNDALYADMYKAKNDYSDSVKAFVDGLHTVKDGLSSALTDVITGKKKFADSFADFGIMLSERFTKNSIDSLFGNVSAMLLGAPEKFATGGLVTGGSGTEDDVPAMMSGGEFVIKKSSVNKYGADFLHALNGGSIKKFASGGFTVNEGYGSSNMSNFALSNTDSPFLKRQREKELLAEMNSYNESLFNESVKQKNQAQFLGILVQGASTLASAGAAGYSSGVFGGASKLTPIQQATQNLEASSYLQGSVPQSSINSLNASSYLNGYGSLPSSFNYNIRGFAEGGYNPRATESSLYLGLGQLGAGVGLASVAGIQKARLQRLSDRKAYFERMGVSPSKYGWADNLTGYYDPKTYGRLQQYQGYQGYLNTGLDLGERYSMSQVVNRAIGGSINGGSGSRDDVPALLMGGEYVFNKSAVDRIGVGTLNQINSGNYNPKALRRYADGGYVAPSGLDLVSQAPTESAANNDVVKSANNVNNQNNTTSNNVNVGINVTMNNNGTVERTETSTGNSTNAQAQNKQQLEMFKNLKSNVEKMVVETIQKQSRPRGYLSQG